MKRKRIVWFSVIIVIIVVSIFVVLYFLGGKFEVNFLLKIPSSLRNLDIRGEFIIEGKDGIFKREFTFYNPRVSFTLKSGKYSYSIRSLGKDLVKGNIQLVRKKLFGKDTKNIQILIPTPGTLSRIKCEVLDYERVKISWNYEGWLDPTHYTLKIGNEHFDIKGNSYILNHDSLPTVESLKKRITQISVKAVYKDVVLSSGNIEIADYNSEIAFKIPEEVLKHGLQIKAKVGEKTFSIPENFPIIIGGFSETLKIPVELTVDNFTVISQQIELKEATKVILNFPSFPSISFLKFNLDTKNNAIKWEWDLEKSDVNFPVEYLVEYNGKKSKTADKEFITTYTKDKMVFRVTPYFFSKIPHDGKKKVKPEAPKLILSAATQTLNEKVEVKVKVVSPLNFELFFREKEGKWRKIEGNKVWLDLPKPGIYCYEFEVIDELDQIDKKELRVTRLEPLKVKINRIFLDGNMLIISWDPEGRFYEEFTVVFIESGTNRKLIEKTKEYDIKLNLKGYNLKGSRILLYGFTKGKTFLLDQKVINFDRALPNHVEIHIQRRNTSERILEYKIKDRNFRTLEFLVQDASGRKIFEKTFKDSEGSFYWQVRNGEVYRIHIVYTSSNQRIYHEIVEKVLPERIGIVEVYQTDERKIKCVATDLGDWGLYNWTIEAEKFATSVSTTSSITEISFGDKFDYENGEKVKISVTIEHTKLGMRFEDETEIFLIKTSRYLYEDIPEDESTVVKNVDNLYISRSIEVDGELSILNCETKMASGSKLKVKGTLNLNFSEFEPAVVEAAWSGFIGYSGGKINAKNVKLQGALYPFYIREAVLNLSKVTLNKFEVAINSIDSDLKINNTMFRNGSYAVKSSNSSIQITNTGFHNISFGLYSMYDRAFKISDTEFYKVEYPILLRGSKAPFMSNLKINFSKVGIDISNSKNVNLKTVIFQGVSNLGIKLADSTANLDGILMKSENEGVGIDCSFVRIKNSNIEAGKIGIRWITSPSPVILSSIYGPIVGYIENSSINSRNIALEIPCGRNNIILRNVKKSGKIVHGGITVDIRGMIVARGSFIDEEELEKSFQE